LIACAALALLAVFVGCAAHPRAVAPIPSTGALHNTQNESASETPAPQQTQSPTPEAPAIAGSNAADRTRGIGLAEAIQIGLDSNLDLALARAQHEIAQARAAASTKVFLPTLDVGASTSRIDGLVQGAFGDFRGIESRSETAGVALGLRVNIGARVYEAMAARRESDAALLGTMAAEQRLILSIVELYEDLVLAKVARDIAQQLVQSSGEFDRIASARYQGGVGLGSDAARATANLAAGKQQLVQAENLWRTTSVRLAVVLRLDPKILLDPADTQIEPWQMPPDMSDDAYAGNALGRPDVQAAREQADAAKQLLRARWWDLAAPELYAEWRLTGVAGNGDSASPNTGSALSSAAGSAGRSVTAWQNTGTAIAQGANPVPSLSSAAGSGGRAFYFYKNLLGSTQQEVESLQRQERYGVGLNWNLSFVKADRIREQRASAKAAGIRASKAEDAAVAEVRLAQNDISTALQLIALAADEIASIETTHRLSLARFTAGTALAFEVLDAQDVLTEARLKRARYTTELKIAQARLLAASGAIEKESIEAIATTPAR
jgi:outer membrane protein TolC